MKLKDLTNKTIKKIIIPLAIASITSCNITKQYNSNFYKANATKNQIKKMESYLLAYKGEIQIHKETDFSSGPGSLVHTTRDRGIDSLTKKAKVDSVETMWLFLPKYELWIHNQLKATKLAVEGSKELIKYTLKKAKKTEFIHDHLELVTRQFQERYPTIYIGSGFTSLPSDIDLNAYIQNITYFKKNELVSSIVSGSGAFSIYAKSNKRFDSICETEKRIEEYGIQKYNYIISNFKTTSADSLNSKLKGFTKDLKLSFKRSD